MLALLFHEDLLISVVVPFLAMRHGPSSKSRPVDDEQPGPPDCSALWSAEAWRTVQPEHKRILRRRAERSASNTGRWTHDRDSNAQKNKERLSETSR